MVPPVARILILGLAWAALENINAITVTRQIRYRVVFIFILWVLGLRFVFVNFVYGCVS